MCRRGAFAGSERNDAMPMTLEGSCRCGAVHFALQSHTPAPYQRCYCSICRKQQGGGGYAINLGGLARTLSIHGEESLGRYRAAIEDDEHECCEVSTGERRFCTRCGAALWLFDPHWPELVHPFASAIDSALPKPPASVHLMLKYKADWVEPQIGEDDQCFDLYPELSIDEWHKQHGLWVA
jgi:hypothetical protein